MDMGIAKPTNKALRNPRKNINTVITSNTPKMMLLAKSLTMFLVVLDWSFEISTSIEVGKSWEVVTRIISRICSTVLMRFFPLRFLTSKISDFFPFERA